MDTSWLLEEDLCLDSESDDEEKQRELETRLYSVIHHNDLSQPLSPTLAEQFEVECSDSGEVIVSLKKPLEDLRTIKDIAKKVNVSPKESDDDKVVIIEENTSLSRKENGFEYGVTETTTFRKKRFRYSDVNIDEMNKLNEGADNSLEGTVVNDSKEINYFRPIKLGRDWKKFKGIKLPSDATIPVFPQDWKRDSKHQFISVDDECEPPVDIRVVRAIVKELKKANPDKGMRRLKEYASLLYKKNRRSQLWGKSPVENKRDNQNYNHTTPRMDNFRTSTPSTRYTPNIDSFNHNHSVANNINKRVELFDSITSSTSVIEIDSQCGSSLNDNSSNRKKESIKKRIESQSLRTSGSISLNISPYKPVIDVSSGDEEPASSITNDSLVSGKASSIDKLPQKWTKNMVKYYTTPSKRKLNQSLEKIYDNFERTSGPHEWALDRQDRGGKYHSTNPWTGKCPKCGHRGHDPRKCTHKVRCYVCSGPFHTALNCPNLPCIVCGDSSRPLGVDQECRDCYMSYMSNEACQICLGHDHHTAVCPDTWRSFHATVEGEKRVPEGSQENPRKWCCNCAKKGHFSHQCPSPAYNKQPSPFVNNYLAGTRIGASQEVGGSVDITVPVECYEIINNGQADWFLQDLSNRTGAKLEFGAHGRESTIRVNGTFEQCNRVKQEVEKYVNVKKRGMRYPVFKNKRRKLR